MDSEQQNDPSTEPIREEDPVALTLSVDEGEAEPLVRVRYGLGKEIHLYPETIAIVLKEEAEELRVSLDSIQRLVLTPGEYTPSKLVLMFDLDDGTTMIAAEGMTNVRDFRTLLALLIEMHPTIELDPPDMNEQLAQALDIRRRHLLGCYGAVLGVCLLLWIVFLAVAYIGAHGPH